MFGRAAAPPARSAQALDGAAVVAVAAYAKDHQPCIIFMDEIDAIGGRRFSEGTSADREIQRTLMEVGARARAAALAAALTAALRRRAQLLNQMDGFDVLGKVKMIMATNRPGERRGHRAPPAPC
jgi:ATP-dependent 26S proteasome regulatory subunit